MDHGQMITAEQLTPELDFSASRSSGPGGQNVNKVNSKVTLRFDVTHSILLTADQKELLLRKLARHLTTEGVLVLSSQEKRSQLQNKEAVVEKLNTLLRAAFARRKSRKPSKPTKSSIQSRLQSKKRHAEKKQWRKKAE